MTTHSLTLSPHEVRAALRGELGLVVRPVKFPKGFESDDGHPVYDDRGFVQIPGHGTVNACLKMQNEGIRCPLGVPGDRLIGKETWRVGAWREPGFNVRSRFAIDYQASPEITKTPWIEVDDDSYATELRCRVFKELIGKGLTPPFVWEPGKCPLSWRSPAAMPAWASRITLGVVGVRCVRVRELCSGKGFESMAKETWDAKYAKRGLGWETDPWVWAAGVRRVEKGLRARCGATQKTRVGRMTITPASAYRPYTMELP